MDYYNIIIDALERLIRWSQHKKFYSVNVSFKIEVLDELQDKEEFLIPHICVHTITNDRNEIIDLRLSFGLLFDGEYEARSKEKYDEIMGSGFGFMFGIDPISQYNLSASLGKDVKMASALILYFIRLLTKSKEIEIRPLYFCPMVLNGKLSLLQRCSEIKPSVAIKNLMHTMFDRIMTKEDYLLLEILRDTKEDIEFMADVSINKWHGGEGYTAWINTREKNMHFIDAMFKRFLDYPNKYCAEEFNINDNSLDVRVEFQEAQIYDLVYFISDCLYMFYPSLREDKIIARVKCFNPLTTIQFYLTFYPDGETPSDKELEYMGRFRDNWEYNVEEDECFESEDA